MMKLSARRLLSGASTIAIAAALAQIPAFAGVTRGPGNEPPIIISADTDFVHVNSATVAADGAGNAFVIQSGVTVSSSGVVFQDSLFQGNVVNNGKIVQDSGAGWTIVSTSILGSLDNNGVIIGGDDVAVSNYGLFIGNSTIYGGLHNTGTINGGEAGTAVPGIEITGSTILDDITNSGEINGGTGTVFAGGVLINDTHVLGAIRVCEQHSILSCRLSRSLSHPNPLDAAYVACLRHDRSLLLEPDLGAVRRRHPGVSVAAVLLYADLLGAYRRRAAGDKRASAGA